VAVWYGAGLATTRSRELFRGCRVSTPTQHAIHSGSVNEYQRKLGSKRAHHATQPY